jgi:hypothetical protein
MPMGEWAWKEHLEKKQEEAFEMEEIEKRLAGIYAGMDPAQVGLLTSGMATKQLQNTPEPVKGRLLEYQVRFQPQPSSTHDVFSPSRSLRSAPEARRDR